MLSAASREKKLHTTSRGMKKYKPLWNQIEIKKAKGGNFLYKTKREVPTDS
jgi:hypothetical protein